MSSIVGSENLSLLDYRPTSRRESAQKREMLLRESSLGQLRDLYSLLPLPDSPTPSPAASLDDINEETDVTPQQDLPQCSSTQELSQD